MTSPIGVTVHGVTLDGPVKVMDGGAPARMGAWEVLDTDVPGYPTPLRLAVDGVGSWWQLPRAVEHDGTLYTGGVTTDGLVFVAVTVIATGQTTVCPLITFDPADDHNNPALLIEPGKPPIVAVTEHNGNTSVWRGTTPGDLSTLGDPVELTWPFDASYMQLYRLPGTDTVVLITRSGGANQSWYWKKSTDYGVTWGPSQLILTAADGLQYYLATVQAADGRLRFASYGHPDISTIHDIAVGAIDLDSGAITTLDGVITLGSVGAGVSSAALPVAYPAGTKLTRLFDISAATDPEIAFASWTGSGDATYHYARAGDGWIVRDLAIAGPPIGDALNRRYLGGMTFPNPAADGTVYLSRKAAGLWRLERHTTGDGGATWTVATLHAGLKVLARPYAPLNRDAGPELTFYELDRYDGYTDFAGSSRALLPPTA